MTLDNSQSRDSSVPHDAYAALRVPNYRFFAGGFSLASTGLQMQSVALGWEIYERTGSALDLGLVGLFRALPVLALALHAGYIIDSFSRRKILLLTQIAFALVSLFIAFASFHKAPIAWIYALIFFSGFARVFNGPARASLLPTLVPPSAFHNAVTWNSGIFQCSSIVGPLLAGAVIFLFNAAWIVYLLTALSCLAFSASACFIKINEPVRTHHEGLHRGVVAGVRHLWSEKAILGAITLDLLAVLLGGATALLPIYAKDILHVDVFHLGVLRAAPNLGALACLIFLAHRPPMKRSGLSLLASVAGFGLATIVFGFSTNFFLSIAALFAAGALDSVSIVIRHVLVQARTPDHLRGRVASVNSVFIESSNELGAYESGLVAYHFGPIVSVVSGGMGTLAVVLGVALAFPTLRRLRELRLDSDNHSK